MSKVNIIGWGYQEANPLQSSEKTSEKWDTKPITVMWNDLTKKWVPLFLVMLVSLFVCDTAQAQYYNNYNQVDRVIERVPTVRLNVFAPHNRVTEKQEFVEETLTFVDRHGNVRKRIVRRPVQRQQVREQVQVRRRFARHNNVLFLETVDNHGRVLVRERVRQNHFIHNGARFVDTFDSRGRFLFRQRLSR